MKRRIKGMAYPITQHPKGYFRNGDSDSDEIKSSIATIILTAPGERIFEPYFGIDLDKVNTNGPKEIVESDFRMRIANALKRWEKRVQVEQIKTNLEVIENNLVLLISVSFIDPTDINNLQELTIYKSLGGIDGKRLPF